MIREIISMIINEKNCSMEKGCITSRAFYRSERYIIDFADDFKNGWMQFDTSQDAFYFGVWVNKETCEILSFCEGDWTHKNYMNPEYFNKGVQDLIDFYKPGFIFKSISSAGIEVFRQDRADFFIKKQA